MPKDEGLMLEKVNGVTRSVYRQQDNTVILADKCTCFPDYSKPDKTTGVSFAVKRDPKCPVDAHRSLA